MMSTTHRLQPFYKMTRLFAFLLLIFISASLFGQVDSIEKQVLNFEDSRSANIMKGRSLLLDRFLENDIQKVRQIKNYLMEKCENENYIALFPEEYWFILYWTNEYDELTGNIKAFDTAKIRTYVTRIHPQYDMLFEKLKSKSIENAAKLKGQIQKSDLNSETKDFLLLNFKYLTTDVHKNMSLQDSINWQADNFLAAYPASRYNDYIQRFVRFKMVHKNWGIGVEFFSGYGLFTGQLSRNYTNNVPIGVAFDICYKNFTLFLRDYIGFNSTKKDFYYSKGIWGRGSQMRVFLPEASLGYAVINSNRCQLLPFAGIAGMEISPPSHYTDKEPELDEVSLHFTTTWVLGLNFDLKLGRKPPAWNPSTSYGFIRFRYSFCLPQFAGKYKGVSGCMHYLTVGIGVLARGTKRQYYKETSAHKK